ncbi:hypothetical protein Tco_1337936 [Tanacetum coccineum]
MDIEANDKMDGPELIHPYEVGEGALMPLLAKPDTPSDPEPEVKANTIGTIRQVPLTKRMPFNSIHVRIRSSSTSLAGHDPEDLVLSRIRSDLDALHGLLIGILHEFHGTTTVTPRQWRKLRNAT